MKVSPNFDEIRQWLVKHNPLELFDKDFTIEDIDPKPWSGHFNYLIKTPTRELVMRFKGAEWGDTQGLVNEYETLKKLKDYKVGGEVYYLNKHFFGEPVLFQEYLKGKTLDEYSHSEQHKIFKDVAQFIAKINSIPFKKHDFPFREPLTSYMRSKKTWNARLDKILNHHATHIVGKELGVVLPLAHNLLDTYEHRLQSVIKSTEPAFVFESSHMPHCIKTHDGFRFFNWEHVSYGDPSYTLAVFLTSINTRKDFDEIKEMMISSYLDAKPIPEFREILEQRMIERHISNVIYGFHSVIDTDIKIAEDWYEKIKKVEEVVRRNL